MCKIVINVVLARWEAGLGFSLLKIGNNIYYFGFFSCFSDDMFHYINAKCGVVLKKNPLLNTSYISCFKYMYLVFT